jgi:hypothetical protein
MVVCDMFFVLCTMCEINVTLQYITVINRSIPVIFSLSHSFHPVNKILLSILMPTIR